MQRIAAIIVGLFLVIFLSLLGVALSSYGKLESAAQLIDQPWSQLQALNGERDRLLKDLATQGQASAGDAVEQARFASLLKARAQLGNLRVIPKYAPPYPEQIGQYKQALDSLRSALEQWQLSLAAHGADPKLEILSTQAAREKELIAQFNAATDQFNAAATAFPAKLVAPRLGFRPRTHL